MKTLLIVDLQKEFRDDFGEYERCLEYIRENRDSYERIVATVFCQDKANPNFVRNLNWTKCMNCDETSLEFDLNGVTVVIKNGYGLPPGMFSPKDEITVIGCNADACVLAISYGLWDDGLSFRILTDYVYTTSHEYMVRDIIPIYKRNFGEKCLMVEGAKNGLFDRLRRLFR